MQVNPQSDISDVTLLALLLDKDMYELVEPFVDFESLDKYLVPMFRDVKKYYKEAEETLDRTSFIVWFKNFGKYRLVDETHRAYYDKAFQQLEKVEVTDQLKVRVIRHYYEKQFKSKLQKLLDYSVDIAQIQDLLDEYADKLSYKESHDDVVHTLFIEDAEEDRKENGLQFRLDILRDCIGPLTVGDFVLFFGYVHNGKTALLVSESTYIAQQIKDGCVLYLNNEESTKQMQDKLRVSLLGQPLEVIKSHHTAANEAMLKKLNGDMDRIKFVDISGMTWDDIQHVITTNNPKLIVVDQIDNIEIKTGKDMQERVRLGKLYKLFRRIANTVCPVIGVGQSDASTQWVDYRTQEAKYQLFPEMSQMAESKVAKQAALDYIVGIGQDPEHPNVRGIHVSKSKYLKQSRKNKTIVNVNWDILRYENP